MKAIPLLIAINLTKYFMWNYDWMGIS